MSWTDIHQHVSAFTDFTLFIHRCISFLYYSCTCSAMISWQGCRIWRVWPARIRFAEGKFFRKEGIFFRKSMSTRRRKNEYFNIKLKGLNSWWGNTGLPSWHFWRRFDVEKALKNGRIFDVEIWTFNWRRYFNAFIGRRKSVEKCKKISTSIQRQIDVEKSIGLGP